LHSAVDVYAKNREMIAAVASSRLAGCANPAIDVRIDGTTVSGLDAISVGPNFDYFAG
jgi:hypothetical protein